MTTTATPVAEDWQVTCRALQLALVATQLRTAWHAGVMDADAAMRSLDLAVRELSGRRTRERQSSHA
jgi:hypothetical protein